MDIPPDIQEAVDRIEDYFEARGVISWSLGNIQSKHQPLAQPPGRVVDATTDHVYAAVASMSKAPDTPIGWIHQAGLQLGLMTMSGRLVRLKLLDGRVLRIQQER